jgi:hypothetical protein
MAMQLDKTDHLSIVVANLQIPVRLITYSGPR